MHYIVEKVVRSVFYAYIFDFINHFLFIFSICLWSEMVKNDFVLLDILSNNSQITAMDNAIVINENSSKIYRGFVFYRLLSSLKFVFVSSSCDSITSTYIIAESSIILGKCYPFSQLHVVGFQT